MAIEALPQAERFFAAGITVVLWVPAIEADDLVPTTAELSEAIDLSGEVADWSGWSVQSGTIDTPDLKSRFTSQIGGRTTAPASSITFYGDPAGDDVRQVLRRNDKGNILIADGGLIAGNPADVFPVKVLAVPKQRSVGDNAFQLLTNFSIEREPAEDITLPTLPA